MNDDSYIKEAPIPRKRDPTKNKSVLSVDYDSSIEAKSKPKSSIEDTHFSSKFESFIFKTISSLKSTNEALLNNNKLLSEALANSNKLTSQIASNTLIKVSPPSSNQPVIPSNDSSPNPNLAV